MYRCELHWRSDQSSLRWPGTCDAGHINCTFQEKVRWSSTSILFLPLMMSANSAILVTNILIQVSIVLSALEHKTKHDVMHTNKNKLVFLHETKVHGKHSSLCSSECGEISLSDGNHKHIQRFDTHSKLCKCFEAAELNYFRYNEVSDHILYLYDRELYTLNLSNCIFSQLCEAKT